MQQWPYKAVGKALEVIPRTLIQNCGSNTIRVLTQLRVRAIYTNCNIDFVIATCGLECTLFMCMVSLL